MVLRRFTALGTLVALGFLQPHASPIYTDVDPVTQPVPAQPLIKRVPPGLPPDFPLRFSQTEWDIGRVDDDFINEHTFWIRNASSQPVRAMYNEGPDRTCIFSWRTIEPGDRKPIHVRFDARTRRGAHDSFVAVQVEWGDPPRSATARLGVHAVVLPKLFIDPVKLYLSEVPHDRGAEARVLVHSRLPGFRLTSIRRGDRAPALEYEIGTAETIDYLGQPYQRIPVTLRVPPGVPIGQHEWELEFIATSN